MNQIEHLLVCLAEECNEVAKEVSKALRFGLDDKLTKDPFGPRGTEGPTNAEKIALELNDLMAVWAMLRESGALPPAQWDDQSMQKGKKIRVRNYMRYAAHIGALQFKEANEPGKGREP